MARTASLQAVADMVRYAARFGMAAAGFTEVESGRNPDWPELAKAIRLACLTSGTLIIVWPDLISRNATFLLTL